MAVSSVQVVIYNGTPIAVMANDDEAFRLVRRLGEEASAQRAPAYTGSSVPPTVAVTRRAATVLRDELRGDETTTHQRYEFQSGAFDVRSRRRAVRLADGSPAFLLHVEGPDAEAVHSRFEAEVESAQANLFGRQT